MAARRVEEGRLTGTDRSGGAQRYGRRELRNCVRFFVLIRFSFSVRNVASSFAVTEDVVLRTFENPFL